MAALKYLTLFFLIISSRQLRAQDDRTVKTDSSNIITKYYESLNSIRVFNNLIKIDKSYYSDYYFDNKKLHERGIILNSHYSGIWKEFDHQGQIIRSVDYNNGVILHHDKKVYPFYSFQNKVKLKGDSILKRVYSPAFFKNYIVWDIGQSYIYNEDISGNWIDALEILPKKFLLRYKIKFSGKIYPEIIEFEIDNKGKFIPESDIKGFEELSVNALKTFNLTTDKAIELAKQHGLIETKTEKAISFLQWEDIKRKGIYSGHFRCYVIIKTNTIKHLNPKGRSTIIDKFDTYVFNPWSATFIYKKKMKTIRGWESASGSSTGLLPDN